MPRPNQLENLVYFLLSNGIISYPVSEVDAYVVESLQEFLKEECEEAVKARIAELFQTEPSRN